MRRTTWFLSLTFGIACGACGGMPKIQLEGSTGGQPYIPTHTGGQGFQLTDAGSGGSDTGGCSGTSCEIAPVSTCGNSVIEDGESCDDGNTVPGDGCSGVCRIDPNFECPTVGQPCVSTVVCGDGKITGNEVCDDHNSVGSDGCGAECRTVESGYACNTPGQSCVPTTTPAVCGNGLVETNESCDDGNAVSSDGCSSACQIDTGYTCPKPGSVCQLIQYCGDGVLNGSEQCDDGNLKPGDCCDGNCHLEPNCTCSTPSPPRSPPKQSCTSTMVCGDGTRTGTEACDDHNTSKGDGCSADCTTVEPGFSCSTAGGACALVATAACGNAILEAGEYCDDGNKSPGDGCAADCNVESGFVCPTAGQLCSAIARCGDGNVDYLRFETCDDGKNTDGDGCTAQCTVELGWSCTTAPSGEGSNISVCVNNTKCGDKKITGAETCDDGGIVDGDGCSSTCQLEAGWVCPVVGAACRAAECGDGLMVGLEECDDGSTTPNDGCSSSCHLEPEWVCPTQALPCQRTVCGDKTIEGSEQCDDGNAIPYDGCSPKCNIEPKCANGTCTAICGDGFKFAQEECDDGNKRSDDGCSADCKVEAGWTCTDTTQVAPATIDVPILIRDMMYSATPDGSPNHPTGHPDFENAAFVPGGLCQGVTTGLVNSQLGADGKPVFLSSSGSNTCRNEITDATTFGSWYHDDPLNAVIASTLTLVKQTASATYVFDSANDAPYKAMGGFFPINSRGWQSAYACSLPTPSNCPTTTYPTPSWCSQCPNYQNMHSGNNFSFTSELRYPFTYNGGEVLSFSGDDDVWVFINGILAVDLGGIHGKLNGTVTLDAETVSDLQLNLEQGKMYEIAVFQAERHVTQSNYKLTLGGFVHSTSVCESTCGDGIVTSIEACDLGKDMNTGAYGTCNSDCTLAAYCGDGTPQIPPEQCDDGSNTTLYDNSKKACGPGCLLPHYCGDATIDATYGELCDSGSSNSDSAYGSGQCTTQCQPAPYCGDGFKNGPEQCDEGLLNGTPASLCDMTCLLKCGNGNLDVGEQCDLGSSKNVGGYDGCNANCTLSSYCGDGFKQGSEQCDDGKNDGSYGTCSPGCVLAGYCGDVTLQNPPEQCDTGTSNSSLAYGTGLCTNQCQPAPYCGDKSVDSQFGEKCDDGANTGLAGSCKSDCSGWVTLTTCGNGKIDSGEKCDDGSNNGALLSTCDSHCQSKCGNGVVDSGEQCDDGVNDGSYGGCTQSCQYAGYCGDEIINGSEQCDLGSGNESSPFGKGKCTKACKDAPYCGDGRVQSPTEVCDGQPNCGSNCQWWQPSVG